MRTAHFEYWPKGLTTSLTVPETTIYENLEYSAKRYPSKTAIHYYGGSLTYKELFTQVNQLAGFLEQEMGVQRGDRVLLLMQNSPQFVISFYAILRINAVVVPINPMNTAEELSFYIKDGGISVGLVGQELLPNVMPLINTSGLQSIVVASYNDYADLTLESEHAPLEVSSPPIKLEGPGYYSWSESLNRDLLASAYQGDCHDVAVLPYTSGTTGVPKGCIHTNKTVQANIYGAYYWSSATSDSVHLMTLPLFHVTGMVHSFHAPILAGGTMVCMTRWNRDLAGQLISKYKCTHWVNISTMLIDFLSNPNLSNYDISSLGAISGGGAPLPAAVGEKLFNLTGLQFVEGYGLSETIAQTHFNPPDRPKLQCLGVPAFDVDARIIDTNTLQELDPGEIGEIVVNGPMVFKGYYNRPEETENAFITIDGKSFFRTGDIGRIDEEGYFFMVDRLKRMINASGFKVWPTEVESLLYAHPAIQQACVVGVPDEKRGETVKAFVILQSGQEGKVTEEEIIEWAKERMAAYKYPRFIEFRDEFPKTSSGKILWRKLQEDELAKQNS
ncbi:fatty-acyl-CoA synthase [Bacillus mesophilus]|uniref:Long-chain fatty acid--CoA ligase n=1 Tax=Bacillus mesophilus TaxID=1808955 RepID=A0A6M0Q3X0_9BACI|nr:long-chain fatty acid--CoA ligase [Bacillus mesophilus]MBM7659589.1 fatty-acyl-CoA synthase [Bacillus mesophilus]NEY70459.1 long-chain fatty acid--CoA ligase [Bacillus mesophilus]